MHPLSVGELSHPAMPDSEITPPVPIVETDWNVLWTYGGYPEPFIKRDRRFSVRWNRLRQLQILREDVRDLTRIQELDQFLTLAQLLGERSGGQVVYSRIAERIRVSENTVRSWISTLRTLHYGFLLKPWYKNIGKALRKEPKWYLRDWSTITDEGKKAETFCACHLLKAVQGWTDLGFGTFDLHYVRDKERRR